MNPIFSSITLMIFCFCTFIDAVPELLSYQGRGQRLLWARLLWQSLQGEWSHSKKKHSGCYCGDWSDNGKIMQHIYNQETFSCILRGIHYLHFSHDSLQVLSFSKYIVQELILLHYFLQHFFLFIKN